MKFEIVEGRSYHCGQIVRRLRAEHRAALGALGVDMHRELRSRFDASSFRKAWLIDGKLAALGGVAGMSLSRVGYLWLALTQEAASHPFAVVREARRQLDQIMTVKNELATVIVPGDKAAMRLAIFLGFHVSHDGLGSPAGTRMERRAFYRFLDAADEIRIPMAAGKVIPMGYHRDEAA